MSNVTDDGVERGAFEKLLSVYTWDHFAGEALANGHGAVVLCWALRRTRNIERSFKGHEIGLVDSRLARALWLQNPVVGKS